MSNTKTIRSLRKLIANKLPEIAETSEILTTRSLNHQPESFLALKTAEAIHSHYKGYIFSLEVNLEDVCQNTGISYEHAPPECRINGLKRADLVIRHSRRGRYRHVVEFKRSLKSTGLLKDSKRLAWLCQNAEAGHKMEKNFLVALSVYTPKALWKRSQIIEAMLNDDFPGIQLKTEIVDLSGYKSTRPKSSGKPLNAVVWEFCYTG